MFEVAVILGCISLASSFGMILSSLWLFIYSLIDYFRDDDEDCND